MEYLEEEIPVSLAERFAEKSGIREHDMRMNLDRALGVTTGYSSHDELVWLAKMAATHRQILEIGAWTGRTTLALADNTPGHVTAVDTWEGSTNGDLQDVLIRNGKEWAWKEFQKNTGGTKNLSRLRMESTKAAKIDRALHNHYDLIFLDASHDYDSVKADIMAWLPNVTEGGIFAGHDYCHSRPHCAGVIKAVDEIFPDRHLMEPCDGEHSIWWKEIRWKK